MKIYIVSESTSSSGGPESLQQLAYILRLYNYESFIYYIDNPNGNTSEKFEKYNNKIVTKIEDSNKNVLIVPESYTEFLNDFKKIKKVIWWLSLDFYLNNRWVNRTKLFCKVHNLPIIMFPVVFFYLFITKKFKRHIYHHKKNDNVFHLYNCEYVNAYLDKIGVKKADKLYLCGPLSDEYFNHECTMQRKNIVLYNPKKGIDFTKKIISQARDIKFIAIENMTPKEIRNLMLISKVYIDFGYFPGPERIPREAVISGCNILTSNEGSARNTSDIPIPKKYKFDKKEENIQLIIKYITAMLNNYDDYYNDFNVYRKKVYDQKQLFFDNILIFLSMINIGK